MSKDYPTSFLDEDFLLENKYSKILYHDFAAFLPIIDYHNHLPPDQIAANRIFENITQIWLAGDHYKWRAMRTLGIQEKYITGKASDLEKFEKWSETVPYTLRNPLYHWTHMELSRYFGINQLLGPSNGTQLYHRCSELTNSPDFSTRRLLERMNVEVVCTTDDPADSLEHHQVFSTESEKFKMFPAFRPDKAFAIDQPGYWAYLEKLGISSGVDIVDYPALLEALQKRIDFFHLNQCRLSDHGMERLYWFEHGVHDEALIFEKSKNGQRIEAEEAAYFKYAVLQQLCRMYHQKGWTQQFHLGALRNNNSRMLAKLGPDTGFDSIGDFSQAFALSKFLNELDSSNQLAKTILYNLNPSDNEVFATMIGNFNDGSVKGKIQFGSGWWFLDQKDGMEAQINTLSNMGLISCFIGMLTDSRSFLSFPRHEYFRRILCNLFGKDMQNGLLPPDEDWVGKIVQDICYFNAKNFFGFHNA